MQSSILSSSTSKIFSKSHVSPFFVILYDSGKFVVAVNKIDKPEANPDRVLTEMSQAGITPDIWGGDTLFVNISAKTGQGIPVTLPFT